MDSFPQRLKTLAKSRVFAISAVLFFAFLTALIIVLFSSQSQNPSVQELRSRIYGNSGTAGNIAQQSQSRSGASNQTGQTQTTSKSNTTATSNTPFGGQNGKNSTTQSGNQQTNAIAKAQTAAIERIVKTASPLPKVQVATIKLATTLPVKPEKVNVYSFRTNYTDTGVLNFAAKIGVNPDLVQHGAKTVTVADRTGNLLSFNKQNGSFFFSSKTGITSQSAFVTTNSNAAKTAANFLTNLGVADSTVILTGTYTSVNSPGSTFVELRRGWTQAGFPIYDLLGIYNLPQTRSLKSVRLGELDANAPAGTRPNYFNTATVEVETKTGKIKSITSSLRQIASVKTVLADQIKPPQQALTEIQNNQVAFSLAVPLGSGFIDMSKVFPQNSAFIDTLSIIDFVPAYWENNSIASQDEMNLYYLACGTTTLDSGFASRICKAVPALYGTTTTVLGESTGPLQQPLPTQINTSKADSLQYGTFGFKGESKTTQEGCPLTFTNSYKVGPGQYIAWEYLPPPKERRWYWVLTDEATVTPQLDFSGQLTAAEKDQLTDLRDKAWSRCKPRLPNVCEGAPSGATIKGCYYIMTGSPSLFLYPPKTERVRVSANPLGGISYMDPTYNGATSWNVLASPQGSLDLENTITVDSLYYEFSAPKILPDVMKDPATNKGFIVKTDELQNFIVFLSEKLGLTQSEQDHLWTEIKRDVLGQTSNTVKLSLVSEPLVNKLLPLSISPQPTAIHRLLFYIRGAYASENPAPPQLQKIDRKGFTVVEVGVITH